MRILMECSLCSASTPQDVPARHFPWCPSLKKDEPVIEPYRLHRGVQQANHPSPEAVLREQLYNGGNRYTPPGIPKKEKNR
jgi:hypothetical protein